MYTAPTQATSVSAAPPVTGCAAELEGHSEATEDSLPVTTLLRLGHMHYHDTFH